MNCCTVLHQSTPLAPTQASLVFFPRCFTSVVTLLFDSLEQVREKRHRLDQRITFIFVFGFESLFTIYSPNEILSLNFEKTVYFRFNGPPLLHRKGYNDVIHSRASECSASVTVSKWLVCSMGVFSFQTLKPVFCTINKLCSHTAF